MKYYRFFLVAFLFIQFFIYRPAIAQSLPQNFSSVNVNDLSDDQIRQMLQQAHSAGISDQQLLQQAENRGLPFDQAQLLQKRISLIRNSGNNNTDSEVDTVKNTGRRLNYRPDSLTDSLNKIKMGSAILNNLGPQIFGSELFRNKNLSFEPNLKLATPLNYIIGPEDQLDINLYGHSVANWKLNVSPEGNINIPGIGLLNVSGKSIEQATGLIQNKLNLNRYDIGNGTEISVALGNIRSIKVIIVGEVAKPGTYTLPSLATVFNALYAAGGPSHTGSYREIELIRNNRVIKKLDVYDFLLKGEQYNNVRLQDQDIIRIPTYKVRVEMAGEVKRPALFEVMPNETLSDVINFAGGFSDQAYTALIKVSQINGQERRLSDVSENDFKNYIPRRGDKYTVEHILSRYENRVTITGAVFRPGEYELQSGMTVAQLIKKAAGIREDAFTSRATIIRLKPDNSREQLSFDILAAMNNQAADIPLKREDSVVIASIFDLHGKYKTSIKGEVRKPGDFAYIDSMTVADLIIKAGGFAEGASPKRIEVSRRVFNSNPTMKNSVVAQVFSVNMDGRLKSGDASFILKPFDIVSVYNLPGYETQKVIKVEGEVVYPGYYTIQSKDEKISDIIKRVGGLTASADIEGSSLMRENSAVLGVSKTKIDTAELNKERIDRLKRLQRTYRDSTKADTDVYRNNFVGIDLKKILERPGGSDDLILENGDVLRIPKQEQTVRINGEVLYPSAVVYKAGKSFRQYILNAGGFSPNSLKSGAYIVYPNGTVKGTGKFLVFNIHPSVKPGSEIYVPKKPSRKATSLQDILGFTTGLVSLVVLFITVKKL